MIGYVIDRTLDVVGDNDNDGSKMLEVVRKGP